MDGLGKEVARKRGGVDVSKKCVFCGTEDATTRDHIPPKSVFPKNHRDNLLTVPSCENCNGESNNDDEMFKVMIGLTTEPSDQTLYEDTAQNTFNTLEKNNKLIQIMLSNIRDVLVKNKYGFWEIKHASTFDTEPFRRVEIKIAKAIYYIEKNNTCHKYGIKLEIYTSKEGYGFEPFVPMQKEILNNPPTASVASDQFQYWHLETEEGKSSGFIVVKILGQISFIVNYFNKEFEDQFLGKQVL